MLCVVLISRSEQYFEFDECVQCKFMVTVLTGPPRFFINKSLIQKSMCYKKDICAMLTVEVINNYFGDSHL